MVLNLFCTLLTQAGREIGSLNPNGVFKMEFCFFRSFVFLLSHHLTHQTKLIAFLHSALQNI